MHVVDQQAGLVGQSHRGPGSAGQVGRENGEPERAHRSLTLEGHQQLA
jgi:hypothetical protein